MAKKNIKSKAPLGVTRDFTVKEENRVIFRFSKECVLSAVINMTSRTATIEVKNENANKTYRLSGNLEEVE